MDQQRFVQLSLLAFALVIASFVVLGLARVAFGYQRAQLLAAPLGLGGFALLSYLFVRATLAKAGLWSIEGG